MTAGGTAPAEVPRTRPGVTDGAPPPNSLTEFILTGYRQAMAKAVSDAAALPSTAPVTVAQHLAEAQAYILAEQVLGQAGVGDAPPFVVDHDRAYEVLRAATFTAQLLEGAGSRRTTVLSWCTQRAFEIAEGVR